MGLKRRPCTRPCATRSRCPASFRNTLARGRHRPRHGETTPDGRPVFADDAGSRRRRHLPRRVTRGVARPLAAAPGPGRDTCLHMVPLP
ncbi:DUF6296 family protein [Kitasatospora sp. NPDC090091]|uniref:DUF6296 family protein n=1 Tax=Kitasatospora sp. NPDC090091 TaxID=3364081 RepID=UPI003822702F